jgi:lactoylglutathione lyase
MTEPTSRSEAGHSSMRMLHTMIRVRDLEKAIEFYTGALDMREIRRRDAP